MLDDLAKYILEPKAININSPDIGLIQAALIDSKEKVVSQLTRELNEVEAARMDAGVHRVMGMISNPLSKTLTGYSVDELLSPTSMNLAAQGNPVASFMTGILGDIADVAQTPVNYVPLPLGKVASKIPGVKNFVEYAAKKDAVAPLMNEIGAVGKLPTEGGGIDPLKIDWSKVNTFLRRKGYDVRGEDDVREIYSRITRDWKQKPTGEHLEALDYASTKKTQSESTKAARYFGYTDDLKMAGYMTPEGKLLDFSGRKQGAYMPTIRQIDHREINQVLDYEKNLELKEMLKANENSNSIGMRYFMNKGNIRMQSSGIDLSIEPTEKQWSLIREHIKNNTGESFYVDISDKQGNTIKSFSYEWPNVKVANIVNDVDSYFSHKNKR